MKSQKGFTLIEALVASVVSLVIPATLIMLLTASNRQMGDGASKMRLSQIATAVSEEVHLAGLSATWVYALSQFTAFPDCPAAGPAEGPNNNGFAFCDDAATRKVIKAFRVQSPLGSRSILESYDPVLGWKPMVLGSDTVKISLNPDAYSAGQVYREGGIFGVGTFGAWAWVNFHFDMEISGKQFSLPMQMHSVVCRNAPSRMGLTTW
jgi:type II secretory pathway pseudopilin PulG